MKKSTVGHPIRYLKKAIESDAIKYNKITFISGPRQVGKTTLARQISKPDENYFTWDDQEFKRMWIKSPRASLQNIVTGPVILDEIHKDKKFWKTRIKGIYDSKFPNPLIVTGSARLDIHRKGSDSLMGRYIPYRLHPFTVGESEFPTAPDQVLQASRSVYYPWEDLLRLGGFPEPLLRGSDKHAQRWSRLRIERLLNEDIRDERAIQNFQVFQLLVELLPFRAANPLSINAIREDVGAAYATVRAWVHLLQNFFFGFTVKPYSKRLKRALTAEPKFYLYDILRISSNQMGQRHENLVALHLLKACHYWTDTAEGEFKLWYVRDREQREADFLVTRDEKPWVLIECKSGQREPNPSLLYFKNLIKPDFTIQLVREKDYHREYPALGMYVVGAERFFSSWI